MAPEDITIRTFAGREGQAFTARLSEEHGQTLTLQSVTPLSLGASPAAAHLRREPFALLFVGPSDAALPQHTYRFEHAELGDFELFIVPIGPGESGMRYEAIFT